MKEFNTVVDETGVEHTTEEGFEKSLVVTIDHQYNNDTLSVVKQAVDLADIKETWEYAGVGLPIDQVSWAVRSSYYWLIRRSNGKMYPWPLLFTTQAEREESNRRYNDESWEKFYSGRSSSPNVVDCPSEEEVDLLHKQVEDLLYQGETPWDYLDNQRGGLTPRWAS